MAEVAAVVMSANAPADSGVNHIPRPGTWPMPHTMQRASERASERARERERERGERERERGGER